LRADRSFVVAIQLEKAPTESWDHLLGFDFHVAVLDIPQLCVEIGLYDALLAAPPAGDGTLASPRPTSPAGLLRGAIQYAVTRGGVFASNVSDTAAIVRLDAAREIPDMRILCRWRVLPEHPAWLVDFAAVAIDPASRGQVTLVSADPMRPARIDPGYLTAPADTAVLRRGVDLARAIAATAACRAAGIGAEVLPGAGRTLAHIRQHADTAFHPVGTCRLGGDAGAVVDPWLRVVGISGLRVVDASVMPTTVAGNAQAAVLAIAERAADFIRTGL
jgi:choline dehydrogenase